MFADLVVEDCDMMSPDIIANQDIARVALGRNPKKGRSSEVQQFEYEEVVEVVEENDNNYELEQIEEMQEESSISKNMSFENKEPREFGLQFTLSSQAESPWEFTMKKVEQ